MQNKKKANWGSLARLLRFLWQDYKLSLSIAFVLIVVASLATVNLTASIQSLVDVYVQPMLKSGSHDFGPLLQFLDFSGCLLSYRCDCQLCVITPHGDDFARFSTFPS